MEPSLIVGLSFIVRHLPSFPVSPYSSPPMSILVDRDTKVICQGITGSAGAFHTKACLEYGTKMVGGVTPGKGEPRMPMGCRFLTPCTKP